MIAQGWTLAVPTLYSVGLLSIYQCAMGFPRIFKNVEIARSSTLEPNDILYFFNYQIKYVLLFVI